MAEEGFRYGWQVVVSAIQEVNVFEVSLLGMHGSFSDLPVPLAQAHLSWDQDLYEGEEEECKVIASTRFGDTRWLRRRRRICWWIVSSRQSTNDGW